MARDQKMTKREQIKKSKKQDELARNRKSHKDSDDDDDNDDEYDYDEEEEDEMDVHEYRKFLAKMFPSKHMNKKIKAGEEIKKFLKSLPSEDEDSDDAESEEDDAEEEEKKSKKVQKKSKKVVSKKKLTKKPAKKEKSKPKKKSKEQDEESESEDDDDEEEEEVDDEHEISTSKGKFNIIFTIGGRPGEDEDEDMWEDFDEDEDWEEDEDEEISTEDEDEEVTEDEDEEEDEEESESEDEPVVKTRSKKNKKRVIEDDETETEENVKVSSSTSNSDMVSMIKDILEKSSSEESKPKTLEEDEVILKGLKEVQEKNRGNKMIEECIKVCEKELKQKRKKHEKKIQKTKEKHERIFRRVIRDKNPMNDFTFFNKLEPVEQKKIIKEVREINKITRVEKPYRLTLLEADIPPIFKAAAMKKINSLRYMEPGSGEFYKIKNWVDTFMQVPFGKIRTLPVTIEDGVEKCHDFMASAQKTLDDAVYGLGDAKMQIMQMLGQLITNPAAIGTAIAIHGPPGTGKTSLVKEGISKILNRPFAFIALGGATDSSFLEGHSYTYEGSMWGKIVQILIDSKCMNPVIYFDELDKISDTPKGEEIAGILTHLTDTSQNSQFHDKYFAEVDFDLSKCLFIFSYNDESKVNPILKDRMYRIMTKGYDQKQKTVISNNYLLPRIREQVKFTEDDIIIPKETIHHIIDEHCNKEDGVRNLKRCIEIIYTKLNLYRLMRPDANLFEEEMSLKVEFPFTVTKEIVDKLIKKDREQNMTWRNMYM
uniref:AAA+ ATPase domain-containing protein n=1 Tax=viral metagenome TaxID=1070528 RepID=A0A6C0HDB5_9ZZZZ